MPPMDRSLPSRIALAAVAVATVLATWLRVHHLGHQVPVDDEWHAIHKLMGSTYGDIVRSFGMADHSIPLTLLYKLMAATIGLDEIDMHVLQVACGIALVPMAAWLAWRVTASAALTALFAFLVADAPFLVLYSRVARPYAITTILSVAILAALWRWRATRAPRLAAAICALAALAAWLHPLAALYPMSAMAFILIEDLAARSPGAARSTFVFGLAAGIAIAAPLALPVADDFANLASKAAHHTPSAYTLFRMLGIFSGGFPDIATGILVAIAAFGAWRFREDHRPVADYLVFVALAPVLAVLMLRAQWTHQGHTFGRYVFPLQVIFLFWLAYGVVMLARGAVKKAVAAAEGATVGVAIAAYLALNPAITQVRTLDAWYAHAYYHFDYVARHNALLEYWRSSTPPAFYRTLAAMPPHTTPIIQAPFVFAAPVNRLTRYAEFHEQREYAGLLHDLCIGGPFYGEVPHARRFRFRSLVFLDDPAAVHATGAVFILLHRDIVPGEPFAQYDRCAAELRRLYGEPVSADDRLTVFDLRPAGARKLQ